MTLLRSDEIAKALKDVKDRIWVAARNAGRSIDEITLIVVTKTYPASDVAILRQLGVEDFGENRDAEGAMKSKEVPGRWHFHGQIQSRKINSIATWADVVHSLDEKGHVARLDRAVPEGKKITVFIQVSLDKSPHRGGAEVSDLASLAESILGSTNLQLAGLMALAPLDESPASAFARLALIHRDFCRQFPQAKLLSAGMSNDFETAIAYGATHIRIGSSILGSRTDPL